MVTRREELFDLNSRDPSISPSTLNCKGQGVSRTLAERATCILGIITTTLRDGVITKLSVAVESPAPYASILQDGAHVATTDADLVNIDKPRNLRWRCDGERPRQNSIAKESPDCTSPTLDCTVVTE